ncbi:MAG: tRNA 2-thiouridine(34) synthase MnmA [Nanobdellota archaeon]
MPEKVVVGMSGGVDSSITLYLLKEQGYSPIGVSMIFYGINKENPASDSIEHAREICEELDTPHHVLDVSEDFRKTVIEGYYLKELKEKRTPNPCIYCNRNLKFRKLFEFADKNDIRYVATGHYAKIRDGRLFMAKDKEKDQTYGLCLFPKEWLRRIILPLGDYTKDEIYKIAKENEFHKLVNKKQSQDLCFMDKKDMKPFIEDNLGRNPGDIVDEEGNVLGKHKGLHFYTIGQRRGLSLQGTYYVKEIDKEKNTIIVTDKREETKNKQHIKLSPYNMIDNIDEPVRVMAKIRYGDSLSSEATVYPPEDGSIRVSFDKPRKAVTPGQYCVFYKAEECLGGGVISH